MTVDVYTKEELAQAKDAGEEIIVLHGELAENIRKTKKIVKISGVALAALTAAVGLIPVTGGISAFAAVGVAALTGLEIATIIAVSCVGLSLILAIHNGYEEVSYKNGELTLKKKSKAT